jgi:hypothetical protein
MPIKSRDTKCYNTLCKIKVAHVRVPVYVMTRVQRYILSNGSASALTYKRECVVNWCSIHQALHHSGHAIVFKHIYATRVWVCISVKRDLIDKRDPLPSRSLHIAT